MIQTHPFSRTKIEIAEIFCTVKIFAGLMINHWVQINALDRDGAIEDIPDMVIWADGQTKVHILYRSSAHGVSWYPSVALIITLGTTRRHRCR